ncbi:hypothetical protein A2291_07710 [candidate division WOR-1 bacterium RIFOXYB2_FULL_42_35]|uniref:Bacterial sugar transferase domain-containing protein n=1 Tax=candidate division WOR-1 bacterium RIFOXYC2_FULL_41_25 TaxID=1802586 RepID=A0A1F4TJB7_UNCSA|nr:MAG: hypothetical protein A2247_08235 [candidate division WOR-1 bacterium RIFOXYA2_FULL_41_14]OGC21809.1 MAG: hypothetical protein A2291_07710 [candidate division WOR-1 bacterium RIFOXYB2_FULL_42_35]OGC32707.1 MAG: hypothetical protein A2462_04100 [candidate division WOR-1 bacterium RIFOXYC2_FULL_41_25]OGC44041.1 MAG: hypothetical protein A2548_00370 [candidate division WOR-1 bacterium RIFOXYD2_FULL_41_8]
MLKRTLDIIISLLGLVFFAPLFLVLAVLIKLESPGPIVYRGIRVGKDGKLFKMFKFRTMVPNADKLGGSATAGDDPRLTKIGKIIRRFKFDESAQLINVLKGEMSLVGPRPDVPLFVNMYTEEEKAILSVKPGLTDWATLWNPDQSKILEGSSDPERMYLEKIRPTKIKLQLKYVREHNLLIDMKIFLLSFKIHFFDALMNKTKVPNVDVDVEN